MTERFRLRVRVRYNECDAQNVVFNARYADYGDLASTEFLRAAFGGYQELQTLGYENQIVRLLIEWKAPARFDDLLDLSVSVGRIGNSSFVLNTLMTNADTGQIIATSEAVYVFVDAKTFEKTTVPEFARKLFESSESFGSIDQSGVHSKT